MNPLTLILLAFFAYYFYSIGSTFFAFLSLAVAIIFALSSANEPSGAAAGGGHAIAMHGGGVQPIVIGGQPSASFPRKFEFRPNFPGDPDGDEWISGKMGAWIVLFGRAVKKIFGSTQQKDAHH
ncbi:MAG TPA: hypothetical protein VJI13_00990 [Candidatus Norongarragalinales archaeon]|nr:hypothetical protein [Candidatus Norongarragalinales archaeon]